ncbi:MULTISPECIES: HlyD family secretion protein [unclassified Carboxylicivirga]|uniref:HlyD family secretion protein n=1 Tax=Carboxylicivirga TaxID=1628153 RepID=UPI003D34D898
MPEKISTEEHPYRNKYHNYTHMHYRGHSLYWLLLIIVFAVLGSLPFIKVDVSVQSRGQINAVHKTVALTAPLTARVKSISMHENLRVKRGDTLVVMDHSGISGEMNAIRQQLTLHQSYIADLKALRQSKEAKLQTQLYKRAYADYRRSIEKHGRRIQKLKNDFKRTQSLYNDGVVPSLELEDGKFKLDEARNELATYKTAMMAGWEGDHRNYLLSVHELRGRIEQLNQQQQQYVLRAPFDGSVIDFKGIAIGHFLNEQQHIAYLSPHEDLIAECYLSPGDIGFIHEGMPVKLQIDTYDYNQWGLMDARVFEVADDVTMREGRYAYLIRCRLSKNYLKLKQGRKGPMKKGMSCTARFIITRRSLFQLLFDSIDDWINPKIMNETNFISQAPKQ